MITAFVVLSLLFYALKNNRKIDIKYIIKLTIHFIIPLLLLFCFSKIQFEGIEVNTRYAKGNEYLGLIVGIIAQVLIYCLEYIIYYSLFYIVFNSGNFKKEDKYVWFEPNKSLNFEGIREYKTEEELIKDLERRFLANGFLNNFFNINDDLDKLVCYEYSKTKFHIRGSEFYNHCRNGRKLIQMNNIYKFYHIIFI